MVTPSLQTIGAPNRFWISTHFERGPSVTRTASARVVAPRRTRSRASDRNSTCLYGIHPSIGGARHSRSAAPPRSRFPAIDREPHRDHHHCDDRRRDEPLLANRLHHGSGLTRDRYPDQQPGPEARRDRSSHHPSSSHP